MNTRLLWMAGLGVKQRTRESLGWRMLLSVAAQKLRRSIPPASERNDSFGDASDRLVALCIRCS
jgi:hypothetical protein